MSRTSFLHPELKTLLQSREPQKESLIRQEGFTEMKYLQIIKLDIVAILAVSYSNLARGSSTEA